MSGRIISALKIWMGLKKVSGNIFHRHRHKYMQYIPICRKSRESSSPGNTPCRESLDSLDVYHGLSGLLPWTIWTVSRETLEKVWWVHEQFLRSSETSWTGQCTGTKSRESMGKVQGLCGQSGVCPWTLWNKSRESRRTGQCPGTKSMESMDWLDFVHGLTGLCPGMAVILIWIKSPMSRDSCNSDLD